MDDRVVNNKGAPAGNRDGGASENAPPYRGTPARGVTARAVVLGLILTPLNQFFIVRSLWVWGWVEGEFSLFADTVAVLVLGVLLSRWLRRRGAGAKLPQPVRASPDAPRERSSRSRWALSPGELLTIYLMLGIGTGLTCSLWDVGGSVHIYMTHAFWFATPSNRWQELVWPNLPSWLTVQNREVLAGLYWGETSPYTRQIVTAWAGPALWWTGLVSAIMWVSLCLNSILRRRWADEEKLAFPMTVLPVQLVDDRYELFRSRLFWIGAGAAAGVSVWNTLAGLIPSLPGVPTSWDFGVLVQNNPPWSFLRFYSVSWAPWYLGLTYLIPLDLAFSLFVFGLVWAAEYVVSGQLGWCVNKWSGFPYGEQQTAGGFIALALVALWLDRRFLGQVLARALGLRPALPGEREEALSYRTAVLGAAAGLAALTWLLQRGGLAGWVIAVFLGHYFLMVVVMCRVRAQLGAPSHQLYGAMPNWVLPTVAGTSVLGPRTMGMLYMLRPLLLEQRNNPAPLQLEGLKMAEGGRMERRRLAVALAVVPVVALLAYFWSTLQVGYRLGMASGHTHVYNVLIGGWATEELRSTLENPTHPDLSGSAAIVFSAVVTSLLYYLKLRFAWWPLHPVAFPIAMSNTIASVTPALFLAWLIKLLLLRYGGLRAHRTALPMFLGLLVGDATVTLLRQLLFAALGKQP